MTLRLAVDASMVRVELHQSGHLVLTPANPAVAIYALHLTKAEPVVLTRDNVEGLRDMEPDEEGICEGWVDVVTTGHTLRVPYRRKQAPFIRELLRVLEQEHGYPPRQPMGKRVREDEKPIALAKQDALL